MLDSTKSYFVVDPSGAPAGPFPYSKLEEWAREGQLPVHAPLRDPETGQTIYVREVPELVRLIPIASGPVSLGKPSAMDKVVPKRNPSALGSYYLGIFSCFPLLGLPLAVIGLVMAVKGLKAQKADPSVYGKGHAITGLILSSIGLLINLFLTVAVVGALLFAPRQPGG